MIYLRRTRSTRESGKKIREKDGPSAFSRVEISIKECLAMIG
jgi:hypothetical protein